MLASSFQDSPGAGLPVGSSPRIHVSSDLFYHTCSLEILNLFVSVFL